MTEGKVALRPIHHCKNRYHLPENDDILFIQKELSNDFPVAAVHNREELLSRIADAINQLIEKDFSRWLNDHVNELPVPKETIQNYLKDRTW